MKFTLHTIKYVCIHNTTRLLRNAYIIRDVATVVCLMQNGTLNRADINRYGWALKREGRISKLACNKPN